MRRFKTKEQNDVSLMDRFVSMNRSGVRFVTVRAQDCLLFSVLHVSFELMTNPLTICGCVAKILVSHLLVPDPQDRATVYTALKSWWICMDLEELDEAYRERIRAHFT